MGWQTIKMRERLLTHLQMRQVKKKMHKGVLEARYASPFLSLF
jgi:hypothetical protein